MSQFNNSNKKYVSGLIKTHDPMYYGIITNKLLNFAYVKPLDKDNMLD